MIQPTIGRKVWFRLNSGQPVRSGCPNMTQYDPTQAMDATVIYVWGDRMVNLDVIDHAGYHLPMAHVVLVQKGDNPPVDDFYCEWMPYQTGQAEKTKEALSDAEKAKHREMFQTVNTARAAGPTSY